ncbi:bacitracin ABC transporter ATP-binding protein [Corynebacterium yudongzhengii]|uniref:Bacitracin ABC transporter ATP-binding protein n=1 Tax=Corynebacterium yudongzhengii TaxID=2080740 RepID=A0A2U1T557_9CORY|nr:ATP-binding cassette domain-containing protein [Corynebacterium yudongzhengii]AWB80943.1 bacitracin ABC transporter ATP-binding protein [Corynebacterium yudongzhengii]PWC01131.1 bacitracin ABC transporter ATP-binding protein [Corynebacterium yudongzhengii]
MSSAPTPAVELCDIAVNLGGSDILHDVNLLATPGRVHALLGRNGAGKSTTFKALLGLVPHTGSVRINGQDFRPELLQHIGSSINGAAYYGHLSARDNCRVHTKVFGIPDEEADRVLNVVGLGDTGRKKARSFSTGMKARLALAIALIGSPEILVLDEPQNGLDPQGITDLRRMLREFAEAGNTVIISSHQLSEVSRIADDVTVIDQGTTVFSGTKSEFVQGGDLEDRFLDLTGGHHGGGDHE